MSGAWLGVNIHRNLTRRDDMRDRGRVDLAGWKVCRAGKAELWIVFLGDTTLAEAMVDGTR